MSISSLRQVTGHRGLLESLFSDILCRRSRNCIVFSNTKVMTTPSSADSILSHVNCLILQAAAGNCGIKLDDLAIVKKRRMQADLNTFRIVWDSQELYG